MKFNYVLLSALILSSVASVRPAFGDLLFGGIYDKYMLIGVAIDRFGHPQPMDIKKALTGNFPTNQTIRGVFRFHIIPTYIACRLIQDTFALSKSNKK